MVENRRFSADGSDVVAMVGFAEGMCVAPRVCGRKNIKGQMKIMQMSFMIIAVFFFFVLVGLFFLNLSFRNINNGASDAAREEVISSLGVIADMPELNYDDRVSMAVDEDKIKILAGGVASKYENFWPIASLEIYKVYPAFKNVVECPGVDCNYYKIFDSGQEDTEKYASYVSICKKVKEFGSVYNKCEVGKIVVGT